MINYFLQLNFSINKHTSVILTETPIVSLSICLHMQNRPIALVFHFAHWNARTNGYNTKCFKNTHTCVCARVCALQAMFHFQWNMINYKSSSKYYNVLKYRWNNLETKWKCLREMLLLAYNGHKHAQIDTRDKNGIHTPTHQARCETLAWCVGVHMDIHLNSNTTKLNWHYHLTHTAFLPHIHKAEPPLCTGTLQFEASYTQANSHMSKIHDCSS